MDMEEFCCDNKYLIQPSFNKKIQTNEIVWLNLRTLCNFMLLFINSEHHQVHAEVFIHYDSIRCVN